MQNGCLSFYWRLMQFIFPLCRAETWSIAKKWNFVKPVQWFKFPQVSHCSCTSSLILEWWNFPLSIISQWKCSKVESFVLSWGNSVPHSQFWGFNWNLSKAWSASRGMLSLSFLKINKKRTFYLKGFCAVFPPFTITHYFLENHWPTGW